MKLRLSIAQLPVSKDIPQNSSLICQAIEQAAQEKADILLTPEGSLSGYTHEFDEAQFIIALQEVTRLARQHKVGLALGTCCREENGQVYNQIRFYAPDGRFLGFHAKILLCKDMLGLDETSEVDHFTAGELRIFTIRGVPIGGLICNDLWANPAWTPMPDPHLTRRLRAMGARVIFHAVNGGRDGSPWSAVNWQFHEANLRLRARSDRLWIVTVDNCAPLDLPCSAPSGLINPNGDWVFRLPPQGEQFGTFEMDFQDKSTIC